MNANNITKKIPLLDI